MYYILPKTPINLTKWFGLAKNAGLCAMKPVFFHRFVGATGKSLQSLFWNFSNEQISALATLACLSSSKEQYIRATFAFKTKNVSFVYSFSRLAVEQMKHKDTLQNKKIFYNILDGNLFKNIIVRSDSHSQKHKSKK